MVKWAKHCYLLNTKRFMGQQSPKYGAERHLRPNGRAHLTLSIPGSDMHPNGLMPHIRGGGYYRQNDSKKLPLCAKYRLFIDLEKQRKPSTVTLFENAQIFQRRERKTREAEENKCEKTREFSNQATALPQVSFKYFAFVHFVRLMQIRFIIC